MSTTIDERVVKMQFDNANFENNVKTSMSTLEKLKQALKLDDASKGLAELNASAGKVDMGGLGSAVESVSVKFTALQTIATGALLNIGNSAAEAGKKLIASLSTDQIEQGWDKYANKTTAVQTIMAATAKDFTDTGEQMEYVNDQLGKLNWFTDETSYNFVDMVSNIGKFTSNGVKLDEAVTSMQGIANWAAISGANANEASRAMYNLSQALGTGAVKLIDWKSIENANMATYEFKEMVIDTALAMGTLKKSEDGTIRTLEEGEVSVTNFNEWLKDEWFTKDVLISVLNQYGSFTDKLYDVSDETGLTATELLEHLDSYKEGMLDLDALASETGKSIEELDGWMKELSSSTYDLGNRSFRAAQEAKTFEEALNSVKDAVSTGWMNTFQIIFGDYQEAKKLWTRVANELWDVFAGGGEARNEMFQEWKDLGGRTLMLEGVENAWNSFLHILNTVKEAFHEIFPPMTAERLLEITNRFKELTEKFKMGKTETENLKSTFKGLFAAIDIVGQVISALFNGLKSVFGFLPGFGKGILGVTGGFGEWMVALDEMLKKNETFKKALAPIITFIQSIGKTISTIISDVKDGLTDRSWVVERKNINKDLDEVNHKLNPIASVIVNIIKVVKQAGKTIGNIISQVKDAFVDRSWVVQGDEVNKKIDETVQKMHPVAAVIVNIINFLKEIPNKIKDIINTLKDMFTDRSWVVQSEAAKKRSEDVVKEMHPIVKVIKSIIDFLKEIPSKVLEVIDVLKQAFSDKSIEEGSEELSDNIEKPFKKALTFKDAVIGVVNFLKSIPEKIKSIMTKLGEAFESLTGYSVSDVFTKIKDLASNAFVKLKDAVTGASGAVSGIFDKIKQLDIVDKIKEKIRAFADMFMNLGTSTEDSSENIEKAGENTEETVNGVFKRIKTLDLHDMGIGKIDTIGDEIAGAVGGIGGKVEKAAGGLNFAEVLGGIGAGLATLLTGGFVDFLHAISAPLRGLGDLIDGLTEGITGILEGVGDCLDAYQNKLNAETLGEIANAVVKLAAAIIVLTLIPPDKVGIASGVLAGIMLALGLFFKFMSNTSDIVDTVKLEAVSDALNRTSTAMIKVSAAVLILSIAVNKIGKLSWDQALIGVGAVGAILGELAGFNALMKNPKEFSSSMLIVSAAVLVMSIAVKSLAELEWHEALIGVGAVGGILAAIAGFSHILKDSTEFSIGLALLAISLRGIVGVVIQFGEMDVPTLIQGMIALGAALVILGASSRLFSDDAIAGAAGLLVMVAAMNLLVPVIQAFGSLDLPTLGLALLGLAGALAVFIIAGYAVEPVVPALIGLGAAITLVGVGMAGVGVAMLAFSTGLATLSVVGAGAITVLQLAILAVVALIPEIIKKIGEGIVELIKVFTNAAPVFKDAFVAIVTNMVKGFTETIPAVVEALVTMIDELLKTIAEHLPSIIESGWQMVLAFMHGIEDHIQEAVECFIGIILGIINGIANKMGDIIQAGVNFILSFIEGLSKGIVDNAERARDAMRDLIESLIEAALIVLGIAKDKDEAKRMVRTAEDAISSFIKGIWNKAKELWQAAVKVVTDAYDKIVAKVKEWIQVGKDLINGIWKGITDAAGAVVDGIVDVATDIWDGFCGFFGIHSPSKKFKQAGKDIDEGLKQGIDENRDGPINATKSMGTSISDAISNAIAKVKDLLNDDSISQPTIEPVLDLDNVKSNIKTMNGMIGAKRTITLATSNSGQIEHNKVVQMDEFNKQLTGSSGNTTSNNITNTFNVTGDNPKEIANEISHILQLQLERKDAAWG